MRITKKLLAVSLAAAAVLSLSVPSFAAVGTSKYIPYYSNTMYGKSEFSRSSNAGSGTTMLGASSAQSDKAYFIAADITTYTASGAYVNDGKIERNEQWKVSRTVSGASNGYTETYHRIKDHKGKLYTLDSRS